MLDLARRARLQGCSIEETDHGPVPRETHRERRKAWRMLQSKAGVVNKDYLAQKALLKKLDSGQMPLAQLQSRFPADLRFEYTLDTTRRLRELLAGYPFRRAIDVAREIEESGAELPRFRVVE